MDGQPLVIDPRRCPCGRAWRVPLTAGAGYRTTVELESFREAAFRFTEALTAMLAESGVLDEPVPFTWRWWRTLYWDMRWELTEAWAEATGRYG